MPSTPAQSLEASWDDVSTVDTLGLEVGYRLVPLVDASQDGELLKRIKSLRRKFAQEVGFLPPAVHIRDNLELRPSGYRITMKGVVAAEGEAYSGMLMAINPGHVVAALPGTPTKDPTFGLPAIWIEAAHRDHAIANGYTVVDAGTVVATHLNHIVQTHAAELLGRQETQHLVDVLAKSSPKLVEELTPKLLTLGTVQKVLQNLLVGAGADPRPADDRRDARRPRRPDAGPHDADVGRARRAGSRDRPAGVRQRVASCP